MKKLACKTASLSAIATGLVLGLHVSAGLAMPKEVHQSMISQDKGLQSVLVLAASDQDNPEDHTPGTGLDR